MMRNESFHEYKHFKKAETAKRQRMINALKAQVERLDSEIIGEDLGAVNLRNLHLAQKQLEES